MTNSFPLLTEGSEGSLAFIIFEKLPERQIELLKKNKFAKQQYITANIWPVISGCYLFLQCTLWCGFIGSNKVVFLPLFHKAPVDFCSPNFSLMLIMGTEELKLL